MYVIRSGTSCLSYARNLEDAVVWLGWFCNTPRGSKLSTARLEKVGEDNYVLACRDLEFQIDKTAGHGGCVAITSPWRFVENWSEFDNENLGIFDH